MGIQPMGFVVTPRWAERRQFRPFGGFATTVDLDRGAMATWEASLDVTTGEYLPVDWHSSPINGGLINQLVDGAVLSYGWWISDWWLTMVNYGWCFIQTMVIDWLRMMVHSKAGWDWAMNLQMRGWPKGLRNNCLRVHLGTTLLALSTGMDRYTY